MIISEKAAKNLGDVERLNAAKRALMRGDHNSHVYAAHKWFLDQNGLMKTVLPNDGVKITPPPKGKRVPIASVVDHPLFFKAVPEAKRWTASVRPLPGNVRGMANPLTRHITLTPEAAAGKRTWLHELTHAAQKEHNLPWNNRGTNPIAAGGYENYRKRFGELEARVSAAQRPATEKAQILMKRTTAAGVTRPKVKPPAPAPKTEAPSTNGPAAPTQAPASAAPKKKGAF